MAGVGDVIAEQYTVEEVASGGMGVVFIVRDTVSGLRLAAKTIKDEALGSRAVRDRFHREARTWMNLGRHENLVSAVFFREIEGRPFLFLEYIDGEDLAALLEKDSPVPLAQVLDWGLQLCRGMNRAHRTEVAAGHPGLVHRDLKPSNLFVTRERVLKVSDFGMAKVRDRALESTAEGIGMGTPYYMPPEQLRDASSADARADVYAAGMVLYELATGVLPLRAERIENQIYNILKVVPPPPTSLVATLPPELDAVLGRCLDKDRQHRYGSFRELGDSLGALAGSLGGALDDAGAVCSGCGLPTAAGPGICPLCGAPTHAGGRFRPLAPAAIPAVGGDDTPAPRIHDVQARPRIARSGHEVTVTVSIVNPGGTARDAVLTTSPSDAFRLAGGEDGWRGVVPPCDEDHPLRVQMRIVPVHEGTFVLPSMRLAWIGRAGRRRSVTAPEGPSVQVEFSYHVPLVGREADLAAFRSRLHAAREGRAGAVVLTGPVGAGRTRLLGEMAREAELAGFLVLKGKALERGVQPMKPLHDGLIEFCGLAGRPTRTDEILTAIVERLTPHLGTDPDLVAYLANFLAGIPPTGEDTAARIYYRWARLYAALASSRPVALVLEDLHWSEGETSDVLVHALRRARDVRAPLLLVTSWLSSHPEAETAARIGRLEDTVLDLRRDGIPVERRALESLTGAEIEIFAESIFPGNHFEADHPWFPQALADISGGQPFFLVQILRSLRSGAGDRSLVRRADGVWRLDPDLDEERFRHLVPDAVEEALRHRLRGLADATRRVAEVAALVGEEFEVDLLTEVVGDPDAVDAALEELERGDLASPVDPGLRRYRFSHALTGTVLAHGVETRSPREARRRHREIVSAMRRLYGEAGLRRRSVRLGRHLVAAGEWSEGFRALVTGARALVARQAYPRAWSALNGAAAMLERGEPRVEEEDRVEFLLLRGEVAKLTGRYEDGLACFEAVVEEAAEGVRGERLADAYSQMGRIHEFRGEYDDALFCYSVGKDLRAEAGDVAGLRRSLNNVGRIHFRRGEAERARRSFESALQDAERAGDRVAIAESVQHLGTLELEAGRTVEARQAFRRSLRLARTLGNRSLVAQGLNGLGNVAFREGRMDRALTNHRRALSLRRGLGDREGLSNSYNNLGAVFADRGQDERALDYYERSAALHRLLGSRYGLAVVLGNIAEILLRQGEVARAREAAEEAVRIRRELGDRLRLGTSLTVLGDALAQAGLAELARSAWEEAFALDERSENVAPTGRAALRLVALALDEEPETATERLEEVRSRLGPRPDPELLLEAACLESETALRAGEGRRALDAAEEAIRLARRRRSGAERARARRLRGRALLAVGREREGLDALRRVVRDLERGDAPRPARAAALLDLGRVLSDLGRPSARRILHRATDLYQDLVRRGRHDRELAEIRGRGSSDAS